MTATFLVGDVYERMRELPDGSFDLIITSPPFLALRSYLPDDHPDKHKEIGSEATPADFLDTMLALTAEWRRLLAPHGSLAIELGDTYSGSGGAGGDYDPDGFRDGQHKWKQQPGTLTGGRRNKQLDAAMGLIATTSGERAKANPNGWPLDQSLTGIPTLYAWSLAYGRNLLTGQPSPAGQWRIRNLKPWIRSNPPVGALGKKERPATSYITVACTSRDRWFDLDAVRSQPAAGWRRRLATSGTKGPNLDRGDLGGGNYGVDPGGAPPLDWWHQIDALIDDELNTRAGKTSRGSTKTYEHGDQSKGQANWHPRTGTGDGAETVGARGWHIRRRLEQAGHLHTLDALDISPRGYAGAHYAVWPPELVRQLVDEMCPRRVCTTCGTPSRRLLGEATYVQTRSGSTPAVLDKREGQRPSPGVNNWSADGAARGDNGVTAHRPTLGWTNCGCPDRGGAKWRPGRILDPFVGSGTTLAVASGMGRDSVGIDLDPRNAHLAEQRVGMFLDVDWGRYPPTTELPPEIVDVPVEDAL